MVKKSYTIKGFDCANCAAKSEAHLNKDPRIEKANIDFARDRLDIVYVDEVMSIEDIKNKIKEVEEDELTIVNIGEEVSDYKIFDKHFWILLSRIAFVVVVIILSFTAFRDDSYFWVNFALYLLATVVIAYDIFYRVIKTIIHKENPLDEYLLIVIATVGAFIIASIEKETHVFLEAIMVATLFQIGQVIEGIATNKSKEAIMKAVDLRVEYANLIKNEGVEKVKPEDLKVDDEVLVTTGEYIPIDGVVMKGRAFVDTSSLTGEFVPVAVGVEQEVYSGCLIKEGTLTVKASKEYSNSTVSKIMDLIGESQENKSKADKFVSKFARWYTPSIFIISILVGIIGGAITNDWIAWILLALKMLVVACPCAIVISIPLAYFSGIGLAGKNGIVIKGSNYLDELVGLKKLFTDKTGTLTHGSFSVVKKVAIGISEEQLMEYLCAVESHSIHPIGRAICLNYLDGHEHIQIDEFIEKAGLGVQGEYQSHKLLAGNKRLLEDSQIVVPDVKEDGTIVYLAVDGKYSGYVVVSDEIKEDAYEMVKLLNKNNIDVTLLTGDKEENAKIFCQKLGISSYQSELLPEDKILYINKEIGGKGKVAFLGDGINDAASIKRADVGFAMGGVGSDIAVDSADIVLMTDKPSKVYDAYKIAKITRNVAIFNIAFALFIKLGVEVAAFVTNLVGVPEVIPMWLAVLADTGLTVLLVVNSLLILHRKINR